MPASSAMSPLVLADAGWRLSLYLEALVAGDCFVYSRRPRVIVSGGPAADPQRARSKGARRSRTRLRRYCVANRLNRLER